MSYLQCENVSMVYQEGGFEEKAVEDVRLSCDRGQRCVLLGPSGSGKTTLLSILGALLRPTTGAVYIEGEAIPFSCSRHLTAIRRHRIGFVFQHSHLLPFLTVKDNLRLVSENVGLPKSSVNQRIIELAEMLGIEAYLDRMPSKLSGGQRQRVAIARALLHKPGLILADEPTAALDWQNGRTAIQLLVDQARIEHAVLFVVTHDTRLLSFFDRVFVMESGRLREG